ncbi:MAG: amidohydrolase family protein [Candidatus Riflebacteria bacterium]|nr:amidohydrolase family protein [Candidatus Riflebacteria bacterium]
MKQVDILFTNALVLTIDDSFRQFDPGAVAVSGNSIVAVGPDAEIRAAFMGSQTVDCKGKILMPGLVNTHTHVPMTLMRGLADDLRLDVWLMGYMMPVEREFVSPEFVRLGTQLACAEMIRGGTTCFADMFYYEDSVAEGTAAAGMRAVCGSSILKFPTPDSRDYEEAFSLARKFIQKWKNHPLIVPSIAPHAPYTTTPEIIKACVAMAVEFDVPLQIHLSETSQEVEGIRAVHGMPVIPYMKKLNLFDSKVIAAHCVHIDEGEIRAMAHAGAGVAHNPSSNLKLASGGAPVSKMLDFHVNVGIGTDGPASNNDLDMFEEMRLTSLLGKLTTGDPTSLPARTVIMMATRGGARAIHMSDKIGSIEPGKRADLILVDIDLVHNAPRFRRDTNSPYSQLVYASKSSDVTDVMVEGAFLMRDRKLKTLNEADLLEKCQSFAVRIDAFLAKREQSILSKLVAIGGAMEEESYEIQVKVRINDSASILKGLAMPAVTIDRTRHYREFDTYFLFEDPSQGRIRYREDEFIDETGNVTQARARLTLIGEVREEHVSHEILLSRSRYFAPAVNSLRFYREYFKPVGEVEIEKDRLRYLIRYKETEFFVHIDRIIKPDIGTFLEIKSRTWNRSDSITKTNLMTELLELFGSASNEPVTKDYIDLIRAS